jgi:hypothetical protein
MKGPAIFQDMRSFNCIELSHDRQQSNQLLETNIIQAFTEITKMNYKAANSINLISHKKNSFISHSALVLVCLICYQILSFIYLCSVAM